MSTTAVTKVFIIGLPGSGKSTLGRELARRLNLPFLDLDEIIEQNTNQSVREIFAQQGENVFRRLEQQALHQAINQNNAFVLATGGGAPCFFDNLAVMKQAGTTLFLDVPVSVIVQRMHGDQITDRPLLRSLDQDRLVEEYTARFEKRLPVYRQAHLTIDENASVEEAIALLNARN